MTEQRAPQELAEKLRALRTICAVPPDCWPGHGTLSGETLSGETFTITAYSAGAEMPLLTEHQVEKLVEFFAAHTASQLAGAVPQEELRALIAKWRTKKWEDDHMAQMDVGVLFFPSHACADELESLIEKRRGA